MFKIKLIVFLKTVAICTPVGWLWGWVHCNAGVKSGWVFPLDAYLGVEFWGMVLEDWLFYPITGGFFVTLVLFDPLDKILPLTDMKMNIVKCVSYNRFIFIVLVVMLFISGFFGTSGRMTAVFFGGPSFIILICLRGELNPTKFFRAALFVIPIEFFWDHWAVGAHQQWIYLKESGIFNDNLWFCDIPLEMTPYLGIMSTYFVFCVTNLILKMELKHAKRYS